MRPGRAAARDRDAAAVGDAVVKGGAAKNTKLPGHLGVLRGAAEQGDRGAGRNGGAIGGAVENLLLAAGVQHRAADGAAIEKLKTA